MRKQPGFAVAVACALVALALTGWMGLMHLVWELIGPSWTFVAFLVVCAYSVYTLDRDNEKESETDEQERHG